MVFSVRIKEFIKKGDFFNSYQLLRYQKQTEYRTCTGGLISIAIITIILVSFASMILDTINRTTITYSSSIHLDADPALTLINTSLDDHFMFGVQVWKLNLNSQKRIFDVVLTQTQSFYGSNYTSTDYPMEPCTPQHWSMLPHIADNFQKLQIYNWLCPTIGTNIKLQGKYSSQIQNQFSVTLYQCNNSTDPLRPCASQQEIDQFFIDGAQWNYFTFYYVNSIVNPDQPEYKNYYLQDRNYIVFGTEMGAQLDLYLNQIKVQTDGSIWPFTDIKKDNIKNIKFNPVLYPFAIDQTNKRAFYATITVSKDPSQTIYKREVQKIFDVFSFMGGLIGAVMATLFIMNSYTSFAYELALALDVFKQNENSPTHKQLKRQQSTANLFHYLKYYVYVCLNKVINVEWTFVRYLEQCRDQIQQQLDIKGLVKRIIFLQYAISYLLQDFHLQQMQLKRPTTPSQVRQLRLKLQATLKEENETKDEKDSTNQQNNQMANLIQNANLNSIQNVFKRNKVSNQNEDEIIDIKVNSQSPQLLQIRNSQTNLKKIMKSAKQGNIISKKLLKIISKDNQSQKVSIQSQKVSC